MSETSCDLFNTKLHLKCITNIGTPRTFYMSCPEMDAMSCFTQPKKGSRLVHPKEALLHLNAGMIRAELYGDIKSMQRICRHRDRVEHVLRLMGVKRSLISLFQKLDLLRSLNIRWKRRVTRRDGRYIGITFVPDRKKKESQSQDKYKGKLKAAKAS